MPAESMMNIPMTQPHKAGPSTGDSVDRPAHLPEGYELRHRLGNGPESPLPLLSPYNWVAIQNAKGIWRRTERFNPVHGPPPYSKAFYQQYISQNSLQYPGIEVGVAQSPTYPIARYQEPSEVPMLTKQNPDMKTKYSYKLSEEHICKLARRFPGVLLLKQDRRVLLDPNFPGYIFLEINIPANTPIVTLDSDSKDGSDPTDPGGVTWVANGKPGSWVFEDPKYNIVKMPDSTDYKPDDHKQERMSLIASSRDNDGALINPLDIPDNAPGTWEFLTAADSHYAEMLGYAEPKQVVSAKAKGFLIGGMPEFGLPVVVFRPNKDYLNPNFQPSVDGSWQFLTGEDQHHATLNLGGQEDHQLLQVPIPTATQVWEVRRRWLVGGGDAHNPTEDINIVFVPDAPVPEGPVLPRTKRRNSLPDPEVEALYKKDMGFGFDQRSGLSHDPYNYGENDQTATDPKKAHYQTMLCGWKKITVDRATVNKINKRGDPRNGQAVMPEWHKTWCYDRYKWIRFKPATGGKMDWDSVTMVKSLDKWREQTNTRNNWPSKRDETAPERLIYGSKQQDYLWDIVVKNDGDMPKQQGQLTKAYNELFGEERKTSSLQSWLSKACKSYKAAGNKRPEREEPPPQKRAKLELKVVGKGKGKMPEKDEDGDEEMEDADEEPEDTA